MNRIFLLSLAFATSKSQTQTPTPTLTWTPTATPMGSSMQTYPLRFPNSDPGSAVRADHLAYLITAIACSANVPIELVFISYIRANDNYVSFKQATHNTTGLVQGCATLAAPRSRRALRSLQLVATPNMLVMIYYLSPRAANPSDSYFQAYASVIAGSAAPATIDATSAGSGSGSGSGASSISTGGIVGIVMGIVAAVTGLACGAFILYANRRRQSKPPPPPVKTQLKWMNSPISIR